MIASFASERYSKSMQVILIVLDGWGVAAPGFGNAVTSAETPTLRLIESSYPSCLLQASGIAAGLPWGEPGNSETGHLNLGAGRTVFQHIPRIIASIQDGSFFKNQALRDAAIHVKTYRSSLHLVGLVSSGSVHSYIDHLYALLDFAKREGISKVFLHIFTDGKDSPPQEAAKFINQLVQRLRVQNLGTVATLIGRVYAMDRNEAWDCTKKAYELLTEGKGEMIEDPATYLTASYEKGLSDQYIEPAIQTPQQPIKENDAVVFFNFREDSMRQLTEAFMNPDFNHFPCKKIANLFFVTMTQYEESIPMARVAFPPLKITYPLARILSQVKKRQLHIGESEKYAHITYFFNGLNEKPYPLEERILIPSFGTPHYEQYPEMGALKITEKVAEAIGQFDFILINFANADMLGHTGDIQATTKGVETIDRCIGKLMEKRGEETTILITADHGNAEEMFDAKIRAIKTKHTSNPVPFYFVRENKKGAYEIPLFQKKPQGILADVAPTILELMGIPIPKEMTGQSLLPFLESSTR